MEEDTEYKKLPVEERCVHKLWKARLNGYEESIKIMREIDDEKSPEWNRFTFLIKKFVVDAHAMAQERGLEATMIFVENSASAGKVVGDVMSGIVQKCIAAQKTKTRELAAQVTLMYVEVERHEAVVEELIKGMEHKNPKIVAACTNTATEALREFGHKVVSIKPLVKQIGRLLSDRDLGVRKEGKTMTVEIYRWIGDALKPQLASLPPVIVTELEAEFAKIGKEKAEPTRYLKSQQAKATQQLSAAANDDGDAEDCEDEDADAEAIDPMDLIDPVDILSKLPKDFYDKLEEKKWQTRKEALEALETLLKNPKLLPGDYGEVVKALKKVVAKDSNVVLVAMAGKCMASLARGLGKKFSPYAQVCVSAILEKFKEKKAAVVAALRDAIDSIYPSTSIENMQEDLFEALANKNPSVKSETTLFLARAFAKTLPATFNKKLLKTLTVALIKTLNEPDPLVRDGSAEALGTLQKLIGEKMMSPYLADVDPLKLAKVKEFYDKAVIVVKVPAVKKARPASAKPEPPKSAPAAASKAVPVKRPASSTSVAKKVVPKKPGTVSSNAIAQPTLPTERELTPEEVTEKADELLPANCLTDLLSADWKVRLKAAEDLLNTIEDLEPRPELSQVLCKALCSGRGIKDNNFQVVKMKLDAIQKAVETLHFTTTSADFMVDDVTDKLADTKNSTVAADLLTAMAASLNLQYIVTKVLGYAFDQKSPKVQSESLLWTGRMITEFGMQVNPSNLIDSLKKGAASSFVPVRQAAYSVLGILYLYTGDTLMMFFESEKSSIKQQIQAEFDKQAGKKPPAPIRGPASKSRGSNDNGQMANGEPEDEEPAPSINLKDLIPRVDISSQITEPLLAEICDKDWKTRNEGLSKLQGILNDAKMIQPNIGDLPHTLGLRLVDMNAKIAQSALAICQQLAEAIGPPCKQYVRAFFPGFLNGLGDGKQFIRTASITCMNVWGEQCGYKEFFEGDMLADALKSGSPQLRSELWGWLSEKMPTVPVKQIAKDDLMSCLQHLYTNICDRNPEVRKSANEAVFGFMLHLGYESMSKAVDKVKPSSKKDVMAALEKTKPNMPIKPLPKSKQQAPILEEPKSARPGTKIQKAPSGAKINAPATARKKEEDVDTSPVLALNNLKNQRMLDEQKMKVLKWSFTSPREEFIELLREQMSAANVNKALMANMFHDDFRYHLKAIDTLQDDLQDNSVALTNNLDLILKWISLRFYDTNPSVLLKGLDYLTSVFDLLIGKEYNLADAEGSCFIPHLLIKIGDPKDAVRNAVRSIIIGQICLLYPCGKVFVYIMDGLKSKNARQRTECLDTLSAMIEKNGLIVCQPTPATALKEIAKHISDRDNSVRSAALNCVVQAFFIIGEKVYKMIGNLSEKDLSMLDERIKRATKTKKKSPEPVVPSATAAPRNMSSNSAEGSDNENEEEVMDTTPEMVDVPPTPPNAGNRQQVEMTVTKPKVHGPFGLDPDVIAEIEQGWVRVADRPPLVQPPTVNLDFLSSPLKVAEIDGVAYPMERLHALMNRTATPNPLPSGAASVAACGYTSHPSSARKPPPVVNLASELPRHDPKLMRTIRAIANEDSISARAAINEISDILESPEKHAALRDHEDLYIKSICLQFKYLSQQPTNESLTMYQPVLSSMYTFFTTKALGKNLSIDSLKLMMSVLLGLMADNKLTNGDDGQYTKVINGICMRVLDRTNFTNLNCALIRLLKETCASAGLPKFTDLLMKCIWRNIKVMPEKQHELDYAPILREIHEFLTHLPSSWWAQRPVDTPLRTIKTIIHNLTKLKSNDILQYLGDFPPQSELHAYLLRVLKNIHKENNTTPPTIPDSNKMITKQTHEAMSNIFKLIAHKDRGQEGIAQLYEFKKQHPDLDVTPFLRGANPVFMKFIEDGLADMERNNGSINNHNNTTSHTQSSGHSNVLGDSGQAQKDPEYWQERLNMLKNLKISASSGNENSSTYKKTVVDHPATTEISAKIINRDRPISSNRMELLQQKLSQMRNQNQ